METSPGPGASWCCAVSQHAVECSRQDWLMADVDNYSHSAPNYCLNDMMWRRRTEQANHFLLYLK